METDVELRDWGLGNRYTLRVALNVFWALVVVAVLWSLIVTGGAVARLSAGAPDWAAYSVTTSPTGSAATSTTNVPVNGPPTLGWSWSGATCTLTLTGVTYSKASRPWGMDFAVCALRVSPRPVAPPFKPNYSVKRPNPTTLVVAFEKTYAPVPFTLRMGRHLGYWN